MKKLVRNVSVLLTALLLACCLVMGLAACGGEGATTEKDTTEDTKNEGGATTEEDTKNEGGTTTEEGTTGGTTGGTIVGGMIVEETADGMTKYTFEAEYTNLTDTTYGTREWRGYSQNIPNPITKASDASNGYCIGSMYVQEAYIYFEIESEEATVAELSLTAGMEAFCSNGDNTVTLSDTQYEVWYGVDGENKLSYGSISFDFTGVGSGLEDRTAFVEYDLGEIELVEGTNIILLDVNNTRKPEGGSSEATAPLIDCISLKTDASLSWTPIYNV